MLSELAARLGILPRYVDVDGREHETPDATAIAILAAMGVDAATDASARAALAALDDAERHRMLEPARVVPAHDAGTLRFRVPADLSSTHASSRIAYECTIAAERGDDVVRAGVVEVRGGDVVNVDIGTLLDPGYYDLRVMLASRGAEREARQRLIVAPGACVLPNGPLFGVIANLYTVRSATNWSVGTLADLAQLAEWSARQGAAFLGINPLHAVRNRGHDISPYSPVSRLFRSAAYLDVESVPELATSARARALLASDDVRAALARLRAGDRVEYERATTLARPVLEALHREFLRRPATDPRRADYDRYVAVQGRALAAFATFSALDEAFAPIASWRGWPAAYHDPASPAVAAFARTHADHIAYHQWIQFELDRQLAWAAQRGRAAGLAMGIYQDLAIGSSSDGSDAWAYRHLFLDGLTIGAPPDPLAREGQNWGFTPVSPHRVAEDGYELWIAQLRAALRHAGALRIDHVLGLFRQFWIPDGHAGRDGAYVRFPADDLLGILALESVRHGAVIVGEDLGTVPPEVAPTLRAWNIHGSRVLLFEREKDGSFSPAASYEPRSLATANTHDLPTLAGYWHERDLTLRHELGLIDDGALAAARRARALDRDALLRRLAADGALDGASDSMSDSQRCAAVHRFLCSTPAALVGFSLDDLTGEVEPVNVPGVGPPRHDNWTRRMRVPLEALDTTPAVREAISCERSAHE